MSAPDRDAMTALTSMPALALIAVPLLAQAAEPEALDVDFLEYLGEFETDDWSWFADDKDEPPRATQKPPPAPETVQPARVKP